MFLQVIEIFDTSAEILKCFMEINYNRNEETLEEKKDQLKV